MVSDDKVRFNLDVEKDGPLKQEHGAQFSACAHFDEVYIKSDSSFLVADARKLELIRSVFNITIWCDVTRAAVRSLISRPNLKELVLLGLKPQGRLDGFESAENLTYFSCVYDLNSSDLLEVAKLPGLQKLGAQQAQITQDALSALLDKPLLTEIDFECSNFDDDFAALVAQSNTITALELGCTKITRIGLTKICSMKQLEKLDVWANDIAETDLDMLAQLPNLEYLSIGGHAEQTTFTAKGTLPKLLKFPALKKVWLDGFHVTKDEWDELNRRYEAVIVESVLDG